MVLSFRWRDRGIVRRAPLLSISWTRYTQAFGISLSLATEAAGWLRSAATILASAILVLDDATCDRSLVMTSSFSNLVWAGRSLGLLQVARHIPRKTDALLLPGNSFWQGSLARSRLWADRLSGRYSILAVASAWVRLGNRLSRCWR